ncbi:MULTISPECIES: NAD(P)/FAD-dependent oxidoreductase [unclassified Pseudomonas]|uniref:NAD(P)/FAD-dependent oxidoreductase n=1 Tax=unclassified Pseudomonas TaxID=196821 RepID=UPI001CBB9E9B|nr:MULTISPECIES: FAD-dependent oxidoreductase [unclassified Pseudomonas]
MESAGADFDLIVVGGGPAGSSAAIRAAELGLSTAVIEVSGGPRFRPGESLAPGTALLISQLLGSEAFSQLPKATHDTIKFTDDNAQRLNHFGFAQSGIHVHRIELDEALLAAAARAGVRLFRPASARSIDLCDAGLVTVNSTCGQLTSRVVIDSTGSANWLSKKTGIEALCLSNPLEVAYRYSDSVDDDMNPSFHLGSQGWRWTSNIGSGRHVECEMTFEGRRKVHTSRLGFLRADSTWRIADQLASPRFVLTGDAACKLDPAASRGVYRALVSGMAAANAVSVYLGRNSTEALEDYCAMITGWFLDDCQRLNAFYQSASGRDDPIGFASRVATTFGVVI